MQTSLTMIDRDLVARLERQWRIAIRDEERAIARDATEATIHRCVRASDRARRNLDCALSGQPLPVRSAPMTQRNRGKAGLGVLAALGRVVARSVARLAALAKARAAAVLARVAKQARKAFRRALRAVVSLVTANTKEISVLNSTNDYIVASARNPRRSIHDLSGYATDFDVVVTIAGRYTIDAEVTATVDDEGHLCLVGSVSEWGGSKLATWIAASPERDADAHDVIEVISDACRATYADAERPRFAHEAEECAAEERAERRADNRGRDHSDADFDAEVVS